MQATSLNTRRLIRSVSIMKTFQTIYKTLYLIYDEHRRQYRENSYDSQQMCLMWSTDDPPDDIEGTGPICDIEEAYGNSQHGVLCRNFTAQRCYKETI